MAAADTVPEIIVVEAEGGAAAKDATVGDVAGTAAAEVPGAATVRRQRKKPGAKWNGRVSELSLKEYREMKWGMDSAFNKVHRVGPAYTMRPSASALKLSQSRSDPLLSLNVAKAFDATKRTGPSFSIGSLPIDTDLPMGQGPGQYAIPSTIGAKRHPSIPRHGGYCMGTSVLQANDQISPAPGDYSADAFEKSARIRKAPAYTCTGREAWLPRAEAPDPGPGEYRYEHCARTGKITPFKWSLSGKLEPGMPRGSARFPHAGLLYSPPGTLDAKNQHCATYKPPQWAFGKEPRGLL